MEREEGSKPMPSEAEQLVERMLRAYERGDLDEMHERTDRGIIRGQEGMTPVAAAFDMENGLISACREYFDMPDMPDNPPVG
jgi:hypothetical protein